MPPRTRAWEPVRLTPLLSALSLPHHLKVVKLTALRAPLALTQSTGELLVSPGRFQTLALPATLLPFATRL